MTESTESADGGGDVDAFNMHEMQQEVRRRGEAYSCMLKRRRWAASSPPPTAFEVGGR